MEISFPNKIRFLGIGQPIAKFPPFLSVSNKNEQSVNFLSKICIIYKNLWKIKGKLNIILNLPLSLFIRKYTWEEKMFLNTTEFVANTG